MVPQSRENSLSTLFDLEDKAEELFQAKLYEDAVSTTEAVLAIDPKSLTARLVCARAQKALGRFAEAANTLEKTLAYMPDLAIVHADIAAIYTELERLDEARDHLIRAIEIDHSLVQAFANLGSIYIRMGLWDLAEPPTRHAISLNSDNLVANQNLAAMHANSRNLNANDCRDRSFWQQTFLVERALQPVAPVVLILSSTGRGNIPHQHLLPSTTFSRIFWFLEGTLSKYENEIPPFDIVFNAVGDPDAAPEAHALACQFANLCKYPIVNFPNRVGRTSRSEVAKLLSTCKTALIPRVKRIERQIGGFVQSPYDPDLRYPLIARPAGRHGGEGARLIDQPEQFTSLAPDAQVIFATEFVDYRSPDGWYRKYRVIFIDRKPYPYHLAIGTHWLLHYWSAAMEHDAQRREEELQFLAKSDYIVGDKVWATLEEVGTTLDLDFVGIDFSILPDERLLLFEANATMLVHPEGDQLFSYKNFAVQNIVGAFDRMIASKISHNCGPR